MGRKRLKVAHKKEKGTYDAPSGSRGGEDMSGAPGGVGGGPGPAAGPEGPM